MKSLNKSLPKSPNQRPAQPPEQLLQAFKSAALSVTNLYKISAADHSVARHFGYQDALCSLLSFLDKENLGVGDGEGWRVRQWATERLDGSPPAHAGSDSDDDRGETTKRVRSTSPNLQRKPSQDTLQTRQPSRSISPVRISSAPSVTPVPLSQPSSDVPRPEIFSFRSSHPYPQEIDMQSDITNSNTSQSESIHPGGSPNTPAVRLEVVSRASRTPHPYRGGNFVNRHNTRSSTSTRSLGSGAGSKRRIAFNDYFDLGSLGDGKDGFGGGGKRGRHI